jgi:hypothetical protein
MTVETELSPADQIMIAVTHVYQAHGGDPPTRAVAAAVISAAVDQVVPEQLEPSAGDGEPWPRDYQLMSDSKWEQRQHTRRDLLAIVDELDGENSGYFFEPFVINRGFE